MVSGDIVRGWSKLAVRGPVCKTCPQVGTCLITKRPCSRGLEIVAVYAEVVLN